MPKVQPTVFAIAVADIHLSDRPPIARSAEPDWYGTQARYLDWLAKLQEKYDVPVLIAGDIFNSPNPSPRLINLFLDHMPGDVYAVPGNHDLPNHRYLDVDRSGYGTLVRSGLGDLKPGGSFFPSGTFNLSCHGFPWGHSLTSSDRTDKKGIQIAVVHAYCWAEGHTHPGAPPEAHWKEFTDHGYDFVIAGDNHSPFVQRKGKCLVIVPGAFIRRTFGERGHTPHAVLLRRDGLAFENVPCENDKFAEPTKNAVAAEGYDHDQFLKQLEQLGDAGVSFRSAVEKVLKDQPDTVRDLALSILEDVR